jgi:DNA polymerase
LVQYGGAVRTLRWAGRGPQIQNFPRPVVKHVDKAIEQILKGMDADSLRLLFGRPLDVVSSCLRGVFRAPEGFKFVVCDYHAIEAIVLAWLANFEALLDVFRRHEDVYIFTAHGIGSTNRTLGKVLRLACGYGMGPDKFRETAATYKLSLTLQGARDAVRNFRVANAPIVSLWHACEGSAKNAINNPGDKFSFNHLTFRMANPKGRLAGALLIELPSGRNLVYRNARIDDGRIVYWGVNQYTRQWCEMDTYGGKLVENATQAVARDLLAEAMVDLERKFPGALLTTVHDEIVAMAKREKADELFAEMQFVMSTPPAWAKGMPLSSAGGVSERYGKL